MAQAQKVVTKNEQDGRKNKLAQLMSQWGVTRHIDILQMNYQDILELLRYFVNYITFSVTPLYVTLTFLLSIME